MNREEINNITERIIGIAIDIHKELGPGFVEKIYQKAMERDFLEKEITFEKEATIKVKYKDAELGYQRVDFIIEDEVILELKAVAEVSEIHEAQLISYLRTSRMRVGLILNFAKKKMDIKRMVNKY